MAAILRVPADCTRVSDQTDPGARPAGAAL